MRALGRHGMAYFRITKYMRIRLCRLYSFQRLVTRCPVEPLAEQFYIESYKATALELRHRMLDARRQIHSAHSLANAGGTRGIRVDYDAVGIVSDL